MCIAIMTMEPRISSGSEIKEAPPSLRSLDKRHPYCRSKSQPTERGQTTAIPVSHQAKVSSRPETNSDFPLHRTTHHSNVSGCSLQMIMVWGASSVYSGSVQTGAAVKSCDCGYIERSNIRSSTPVEFKWFCGGVMADRSLATHRYLTVAFNVECFADCEGVKLSHTNQHQCDG